jgi:hypothetical protein
LSPKLTQEFYFRKTKANGDLAGTTRSVEVPTFDWEAFKNTPNVELFVRRAYQSLLQKLVRDMKQGNKNGTRQKDLISMEAVTIRSFQFNKADIKNLNKTPKVIKYPITAKSTSKK